MSQQTITQKCAKYIYELEYSKLPEAVKTRAIENLIDFMACTVGGYDTSEGQMIIDFVSECTEANQATIIGSWQKNSANNAALANGYTCHILECDDIHKESVVHGAAPIISAALAAAEKEKVTGEEFIEAIVAGYEIAFRVGEAVMPSHYSIWHNTATCGTFGSAAAVGKILKLTQSQLVDALGNAGTQAAGLWEFLSDSAMSKYLHCGKASSNGFIAASLAKKGVTGATKIIEGPQGFVVATSKEVNPQEKFENLGKVYKILENGFKPYSCCRHTHSTIDSIIILKNKHNIKADDVRLVEVNVYSVAKQVAKNNEYFSDARSAAFSLVYCSAVALCYGEVSTKHFTDEYLTDEKILKTAKKIIINDSEEITKQYPKKWMSNVLITMNSGEKVEFVVEYPKGDYENPFTMEDFNVKFMDLSANVIGKETAEKLLAKCKNVNGVKDMSTFFNI